MMPGQSQTTFQHHQSDQSYSDEFGTFQSIRPQSVVTAIVTSNQPMPYNVPQTNTQTFASFPQAINTAVIGQQVTAPVPVHKDFGMFQSTMTPSLPTNTNQQTPSNSDFQEGSNRDSFGDFQSGTNDPSVAAVSVIDSSTIPSNSPYWQHNIDQLPKLYQDVFNTCIMADQFLDTGRLFPILYSSGLQRSLLRDIWSTVNQVQPGRLTKEELCKALGLIALAQVM